MNVLRKLTEEKLKTCEVNEFEFYNRYVAVSLDQSTEIINAEQGTPSWHKARKVRLTASKARAQFTYYSNKNADWDKRYQEWQRASFAATSDCSNETKFQQNCVTKEEKLTNALRRALPGITFISVEDISGGCGAMYEVETF
ncbi:hypothetical protein EVAR_62219_1 [Eumeta japonica]|uniref:Uncharacterized protein n=1 Tax=Eumeta variegata TaxID=151549 RepID=A0A4C1ZI12_EUMVA|nr:hypothetical protein EVAR_62219_1 [Eumeta japonica]